jgi:hypothetical protein
LLRRCVLDRNYTISANPAKSAATASAAGLPACDQLLAPLRICSTQPVPLVIAMFLPS